MSKLKDLIQELCPDGVEYKKSSSYSSDGFYRHECGNVRRIGHHTHGDKHIGVIPTECFRI